MTTPRTKEHPEAGARIRARRAYLNLSRPQVAALSNNVLYVELQKRIEDGNKRVLTLRADQVRAYLDALQWTTEDYERETGVELPDSPGVPGAEPYEGGLNVGYYGTVAAGLHSIDHDEAAERFVPISPILPGLRGRTQASLGLLRVNGDSMVSPKAAETIPEGSMVLVQVKMPAALRDAVDVAAQERGLRRSDAIREALTAWLAR